MQRGSGAGGAPELIRSGARGRIRTTIGYELEAGALEEHARDVRLQRLRSQPIPCPGKRLDVFQGVKVQLAGPRP